MEVESTDKRSQAYDSLKRGPIALEELRGLVQYRDLIYQLVRRDVVSRYKRSALGLGWTMLHPLAMMVVLSVVFSQLFHTIKGYPVYVLSGLLAWNFFSQTTSAAMKQMVWGSTLLHRIYVPRTAFVVSAIGTGVVNLTTLDMDPRLFPLEEFRRCLNRVLARDGGRLLRYGYRNTAVNVDPSPNRFGESFVKKDGMKW